MPDMRPARSPRAAATPMLTRMLGRPASFPGLAYVDSLYDLACHLAGSPSAAEELVYETYARAARAWRRDPGVRLEAWLLRVLRHAWLDRGQERSGAAREANDAVAALAVMPERARTAVLLDLNGLTHAEVGYVLDCSAEAARARLVHAREALLSVVARASSGASNEPVDTPAGMSTVLATSTQRRVLLHGKVSP